jgi:plasmid stabilization system protein ParE
MRGFHAKLRLIKRFPYMYEVIPEAFDLGVECRHAPFKSHRIIYTVIDRQVLIMRVIHAHRILRQEMLEDS